MSDSFTCPACKKETTIADKELWEVYEEEGKETEITCDGCDQDLIITSQITGWFFEAVSAEEI